MKRRFARRALTLGWLTVSIMAGLGVTSAYFKLRSSVVNPHGSRRLEGLEANVRILTDSVGIPHIMGSTELDAVRAQGFMHGADRLWQMDYMRRIAAGRLSEVFGDRGLETDRFVRTLGLWAAALQTAESLGDAERGRLQAYADGVNAAILSRRGILPPEFVILGFRPDPWTVESSLAVGVVMNLDLSHWRNDLSRFVGQQILPADKYASLKLPYPDWGPTIVGGAALRVAPSAPAGGSARRPGAADRSPPASDESWDPIEVLSAASSRAASNAWVISGRRTESGYPILANDMHLPLRAPAIWYITALHAFAEDLHVAGFSLPGVPGIVVGMNRHVAWGFTNGMIDDMDFVIEELSPDGESYQDGDTWRPVEERVEQIYVRGRVEPEEVVIRSTVRGPLISDVLPDLDRTLSVLWIAAQDRLRIDGLWALARARSALDVDRAIQGFTAPHQNVVYATSENRIGYRLAGSIPVREGWTGAVPVSADIVGDGWNGWWPARRHPAVADPPAGFIASANNLQAPGLWDVIGADYPPPFRARRITDRLSESTSWNVESTMAVQLDTRSLLAGAALERAVAAAAGIGADSLARALQSWNLEMGIDSREATVLFAWLYRLRQLVAADEWAAAPNRAFFPTLALLQVLREGDENPWVDDVSTPERETFDGLSRRAMTDAVAVAGDREWGEVHIERHAHPLGTVRILQVLFGFNIGGYASAGGPNTVRPDDYGRWNSLDASSWTPPYINQYGPSERFVAELDPDEPRGWFLIPTGQSGNPFSRHYRDLNDRWRANELIAVPLDSAAAVSRAVRQLSLTPERSARPDTDPEEEAAAG